MFPGKPALSAVSRVGPNDQRFFPTLMTSQVCEIAVNVARVTDKFKKCLYLIRSGSTLHKDLARTPAPPVS